jgi:hypothetical protein
MCLFLCLYMLIACAYVLKYVSENAQQMLRILSGAYCIKRAGIKTCELEMLFLYHRFGM